MGPDRKLQCEVGSRSTHNITNAWELVEANRRESGDGPVIIEVGEGIDCADAVAVLDRAIEHGDLDIRFAVPGQEIKGTR